MQAFQVISVYSSRQGG